jgi:3-dehydro-L-gulonate 2-dehydrogenase
MVLDMIAAMMSLGRATNEISNDPLFEAGISQMFLTLNPLAFGPSPRSAEMADEIVASLHACKPAKAGGRVRYPGEQMPRVRAENDKLGLPVDAAVWETVLGL